MFVVSLSIFGKYLYPYYDVIPNNEFLSIQRFQEKSKMTAEERSKTAPTRGAKLYSKSLLDFPGKLTLQQ